MYTRFNLVNISDKLTIALPRNVHPSLSLDVNIVCRQSRCPLSTKIFCSCTAVVSSSHCISASTIRRTSKVIAIIERKMDILMF